MISSWFPLKTIAYRPFDRLPAELLELIFAHFCRDCAASLLQRAWRRSRVKHSAARVIQEAWIFPRGLYNRQSVRDWDLYAPYHPVLHNPVLFMHLAMQHDTMIEIDVNKSIENKHYLVRLRNLRVGA